MKPFNTSKSLSISKSNRRKSSEKSFLWELTSIIMPMPSQLLPKEVVPVLNTTKTYRFWQRFRAPIIFSIMILVIIALSYAIHALYVDYTINKAFSLYRHKEYAGEFHQLSLAETKASEIFQKYPDKEQVVADYAWYAFLQLVFSGDEEQSRKRLNAALRGAPITSGRNGLILEIIGHYEKKSYPSALKAAKSGMAQYPNEPRFAFAHILAMAETQESDSTLKNIESAHRNHSEYSPLSLIATQLAFKNGNQLQQIYWTDKLLQTSPNNLYGRLMHMANQLPEWGASMSSEELSNRIQTQLTSVQGELDISPQYIQQFGLYLKGRIALSRDQLETAEEHFLRLVDSNKEAIYAAWYGETIFRLRGAGETLRFLDSYGDLLFPYILELKTRCMLVFHRTQQASRLFKRIKDGSTLFQASLIKRLEWILAVRTGDLEKAFELIPDTIEPEDQWPALELYYQLAEIGHKGGITKIEKSLRKNFASCSLAIKSWHSGKIKRGLAWLTSEKASKDPCSNALAASLLQTHVHPEDAAISARIAAESAKHNALWIEVDRAVAQSMVTGEQSGEEILQKVLSSKPNGKPITYHIARAYMKMQMPLKAYAMVSSCNTPVAMDLCIRALSEANKVGAATRLMKRAVKMEKRNSHPALYSYALQGLLKNAVDAQTLADAIELSYRSGRWAVAVAQPIVASMSHMVQETEIDRYLQKLARTIAKTSGADTAIAVHEYAVQHHLLQGKEFHPKIQEKITRLHERGIQSPWFCYGLGVTYKSARNREAAVEWFKKALIYDPTFLPAYQRLGEMSKLEDELKQKFRENHPSIRLAGIN